MFSPSMKSSIIDDVRDSHFKHNLVMYEDNFAFTFSSLYDLYSDFGNVGSLFEDYISR